MPYGAGDLRQRVTFAKPDQVADEWGNVTTGWLDMFTVWANITPRLGGETVEAARLTGRQPVVIRVRQSPDTALIAVDWKATTVEGPVPAGVVYNIRTCVDPDEGNQSHDKWLDMLCEAGVAV
jgi:SPP1 family predicted phage head-tail adaptor